jgi:hypothetical protein
MLKTARLSFGDFTVDDYGAGSRPQWEQWAA